MRHRARSTDSGEMLLLMAGLTVLLVGLAGILLWVLAREPGATPAGANQEAALAGGTLLRQQALRAGLTAGQAVPGADALDVDRACTAADRAAAAEGAELVTCELTPTGFTVVTAWGDDAAEPGFETGVVTLVDSGGCLALDTSWGEQLPAACPKGR
jgi:hypothetical protein